MSTLMGLVTAVNINTFSYFLCKVNCFVWKGSVINVISKINQNKLRSINHLKHAPIFLILKTFNLSTNLFLGCNSYAVIYLWPRNWILNIICLNVSFQMIKNVLCVEGYKYLEIPKFLVIWLLPKHGRVGDSCLLGHNALWSLK
jgi:hypothetical protein